MLESSRASLESDLSAALSRSIGYTTGAYDIDRIASVTSVFNQKPSVYEFELTRHLIALSTDQHHQIEDSYATQILNFAVGLGLIYRVGEGSTPKVNRFALHPAGATVRAALAHEEEGLLRYVLMGLVLQADCDFYGLILDILQETNVSVAELRQLFKNRYQKLRLGRVKWLESAFPNSVLRNRIMSKIHWIQLDRSGTTASLKEVSNSFARHHVTPRLGWARWFGHIRNLVDITEDGTELVKAIRESSNEYIWLGPQKGTLEGLRIPEREQRKGPWSPSWNLLRPPRIEASDTDVNLLVDNVSGFMDTHYEHLRLVNANQAPLASVLPYIYFTEQKLGYSVEENLVFDRIFTKFPQFSILSARHNRYGYYQRRAR